MRVLSSLCGLVFLFAPAVAQSCLFLPSTTPGIDLQLGDDDNQSLQLPFAFPFQGSVYQEIAVVSNGFVWLGPPPTTNPNDFSDSEAELLSAGPRIAVCWDDWNPSAGGHVFFQATPLQVSVIWKDVPSFGSGGGVANMELVLLPTGQIDLYFDSTMVQPSSSNIVGLSAGNGATLSPVDWTTLPQVFQATAHETFAGNFDLVGSYTTLIATTASDYISIAMTANTCPPAGQPIVAQSTPFGMGCPSDGSGAAYELFAGSACDLSNQSLLFSYAGADLYIQLPGSGLDTSYSTPDQITQGDDTQVNVPLQSMGGFPFRGSLLTSVDVCSNGYIWMSPNSANDYSPSVGELLSQEARLAPLWADWNFNQGGTGLGGSFYWTTTPSFCMATWENVAAYGQTGSQNTFQVKLHANGDIEFHYGNVQNHGSAITGLCGGPGSSDGGNTDLSAALGQLVNLFPHLVLPVRHTTVTMPRLGAPYSVEVVDMPSATAFCVLAMGLSQRSLDLSFMGAPGCTQWAADDATMLALTSGSTTSFQLPIPASFAFAGLDLFTQGAVFAPGINAAGIATSNGLHGTVGL